MLLSGRCSKRSKSISGDAGFSREEAAQEELAYDFNQVLYDYYNTLSQ
jgi:hypothetical protein